MKISHYLTLFPFHFDTWDLLLSPESLEPCYRLPSSVSCFSYYTLHEQSQLFSFHLLFSLQPLGQRIAHSNSNAVQKVFIALLRNFYDAATFCCCGTKKEQKNQGRRRLSVGPRSVKKVSFKFFWLSAPCLFRINRTSVLCGLAVA